MKNGIVLAALFLVTFGLALTTITIEGFNFDVRENNTRNLPTAGSMVGFENTGDIIVKYFASLGLKLDLTDNPQIVGRYNSRVIELMKTKLLDDGEDPFKEVSLEADINMLIYKSELERIEGGANLPQVGVLDSHHEAALSSLDLIIPTGPHDDHEVFVHAKQELHDFVSKAFVGNDNGGELQVELAKELLERLVSLLTDDSRQPLMLDVARYLRNFKHHWIPLARLMFYVEKYGGVDGTDPASADKDAPETVPFIEVD